MSDLISREAAIVTAVKAAIDWHRLANPQYSIAYCIGEAMRELPSAELKGKWIEKTDYIGDTYYDCSACGESWTTIDGTPWENGMNFCPHCGARMVRGEEDE